MAEPEVPQFLTPLVVEERVTPSLQTQARVALAFVYRHVLLRSLGPLEGVVRAARLEGPRREPTRRRANTEGVPAPPGGS